MTPDRPSLERLDALELLAVELASAGGAQIASALTRTLSVRYKTEASGGLPARDPVSDVDRAVEEALRESIERRFPEHAVLGEELEARQPERPEFVWVIDPIDGTTNFLHGFPMFACSVGVLHRGEPVVGAVWCSTSHELRPGVYHGRPGGDVRFDGRALRQREPNSAVVSRLFGDPGRVEARADHQGRTTGSAALECALVAAGVLDSALFEHPRIWDVAGGIALVLASGRGVWSGARRLAPFASFVEPGEDARDLGILRGWGARVLLGAQEGLAATDS